MRSHRRGGSHDHMKKRGGRNYMCLCWVWLRRHCYRRSSTYNGMKHSGLVIFSTCVAQPMQWRHLFFHSHSVITGMNLKLRLNFWMFVVRYIFSLHRKIAAFKLKQMTVWDVDKRNSRRQKKDQRIVDHQFDFRWTVWMKSAILPWVTLLLVWRRWWKKAGHW